MQIGCRSLLAMFRPVPMRTFGKRPNFTDAAYILLLDRAPMPCRIIERTLRIVHIVTADPKSVDQLFTLVLNNGAEKVFCRVVSAGDSYLVARYCYEYHADDTGRSYLGMTLDDAEAWKGHSNSRNKRKSRTSQRARLLPATSIFIALAALVAGAVVGGWLGYRVL